MIKVDYNTESASRGKFARIAVEINLNKPLVSQFLLDGRIQKIEYESLPTICFECGIYGHYCTNCPEKVACQAVTKDDKAGRSVDGDITVMKCQLSSATKAPKFGPWMVLAREGKNRSNKESTKITGLNLPNDGKSFGGLVLSLYQRRKFWMMTPRII